MLLECKNGKILEKWLWFGVLPIGGYFTSEGSSAQGLGRRLQQLQLLTFDALVDAGGGGAGGHRGWAAGVATQARIDMQPDYLHHRVELVHGMTDILDGQILGHVQDIEGERFPGPARNGNLRGNRNERNRIGRERSVEKPKRVQGKKDHILRTIMVREKLLIYVTRISVWLLIPISQEEDAFLCRLYSHCAKMFAAKWGEIKFAFFTCFLRLVKKMGKWWGSKWGVYKQKLDGYIDGWSRIHGYRQWWEVIFE